MPGKTLKTQAQQLVLNLCKYFEMEKVNGGPLLPVSSVQEKVANALKISRKTVYTIKKRKENNPILSSPGKSRSRSKPKTTNLPEGTKMAVRNTLYDMYKERKHVTIKSLNTELKNKEIVFLGKTSLNVLLKELGFKYKKDDHRRALIEKTAISSLRACFLRKYIENRDSTYPRKVIFLDETWIYSKGSKTMSWQDDNVKSVRKPEGYDGKRFIVVHAGSSTGFVEEASLVFASKSLTSDYHGEMNSTIFTKWVSTQLIPNLEEPSLVIMDNAPYHSMLQERQPCTSFTKAQIVTWLKAKNIQFDEKLTKPELLSVAKMNRKENVYIIDELLREHGHEVLRLPPYHCDFNAIELIWANSKSYYNKHIGRDGYSDANVISMWKEALEKCNAETWERCVSHTENLIEEWFTREQYIVDIQVEPIIINTEESSDSESNDDML